MGGVSRTYNQNKQVTDRTNTDLWCSSMVKHNQDSAGTTLQTTEQSSKNRLAIRQLDSPGTLVRTLQPTDHQRTAHANCHQVQTKTSKQRS